MPVKFERRGWIFASKSIGQPDPGVMIERPVLGKNHTHELNLLAQRLQQFICKRHQAVLPAFPVNHPNLAEIEIDILDAQTNQLYPTQTRTIEKRRHQLLDTLKLSQQGGDFAMRQNNGKFALLVGATVSGQVTNSLAQKLCFKKSDGVKRQSLGAGRNIPFSRKEGKKALDLLVAKLGGMLLTAEQNKKLYPVQVGLDSAPTIALYLHEIFDRFQKGRSCHV